MSKQHTRARFYTAVAAAASLLLAASGVSASPPRVASVQEATFLNAEPTDFCRAASAVSLPSGLPSALPSALASALADDESAPDSASEDRPTSGSWIRLFDGKSLSGWRANSDPAAFTIVDGAIRANSSSDRIAHLFYWGDNNKEPIRFRDFELELSARSEPNSNSGIFLHTNRTTRSKRLYLDYGYEVQLNSSSKEKRKTGSLYAVVDIDQSIVDETRWFRVNVRVQGQRIQVRLDDQLVVDYLEPLKPVRAAKRKHRKLNPEGGAIALQAHDRHSVFFFRDIRIRRLSTETTKPAK